MSTVYEEVLMAVRQHGRMCIEKGLWLACESAGDSTPARCAYLPGNDLKIACFELNFA